MPQNELCHACHIDKLAMMQSSPYSVYNEAYKRALEHVYSTCGKTGPTNILPSVVTPPEDRSLDCGTNEWYTVTGAGETCNSIALKQKISSASLFMANQYRLDNCSIKTPIPSGTKLCVPSICHRTLTLQSGDTCESLEANSSNALQRGDVLLYNPWAGYECVNLQAVTPAYGTVICLGPQYEQHNASIPIDDTTTPRLNDCYTYDRVDPPKGAVVAKDTTTRCGRWYVATKDSNCVQMAVSSGMMMDLLLKVNPSLGTDASACSTKLIVGNAYCIGPNHDWLVPFKSKSPVTTTITITDAWAIETP